MPAGRRCRTSCTSGARRAGACSAIPRGRGRRRARSRASCAPSGRGAGREHVSIHIRDWHDPEDPATRAHLEHFGSHCVRGTPGRGVRRPARSRVVESGGIVVDSAVLSDFVGTTLEATLRPLADGAGAGRDHRRLDRLQGPVPRLRAADAARAPRHRGVRRAHRLAQPPRAPPGARAHGREPRGDGDRQHPRVPGAGWVSRRRRRVRAGRGPAAPGVELPDGTSLDDEERRLVEHLYRECRSVRLVPIGGGYSGSRVFGSFPVDRRGRREIPFVTKLDRHDRIARERVAVEGVENLLGANAPRLADYVDLETRGAIKYHFATMHGGQVRTLQRAFREADGPSAARVLFDRVIDRLLRRLYQSPQLDRLDLFAYYGFTPRYAEATLARVAELAEARADAFASRALRAAAASPAASTELLHGAEAPGAEEVACCDRPRRPEPRERPPRRRRQHLADRLLLDAHGHALDDIAKLENDLKFIMVPLPDDAALGRAFALEQHLGSRRTCSPPRRPKARPPRRPGARQGPRRDRSPPRAGRGAAARGRPRGAGARPGVPNRPAPLQRPHAELRRVRHRQKRFALASTCLLADRLEPTLGR